MPEGQSAGALTSIATERKSADSIAAVAAAAAVAVVVVVVVVCGEEASLLVLTLCTRAKTWSICTSTFL